MSVHVFPPNLSGILAVLDIIDIPAFVLTVDASGKIRFAGLNRAHEAQTGMVGAEIAGLTPHEALPPRMADTVLANYAHCVERGQTYRYEEVLDLPAGRNWWLTTLSPVFEDGRITAVVGLATDITAQRIEIADASFDIGALQATVAGLQTLGRAVTSETRGPLNNILALGRLLRAEFQPPTTKKDEVLDLMLDTALSALEQIDGFELECETAPAQSLRECTRVDLDHTCRDLAALIDPDRTLSILFPEAWIVVDANALHSILHALLETVAGRAQSYIHISVAPGSRTPYTVSIRIAFDPDGPARESDPAWLRASVEARGGTLRSETGEGGQTPAREVIELVLPGKILPHDEHVHGRTARAVNRRPDRASGSQWDSGDPARTPVSSGADRAQTGSVCTR